MLTMLGIPNCDTVKKSRKYLEGRGVTFTFRDVRKQPLAEAEWCALLDSDDRGVLINTRSPSFRKTGKKSADLNTTQDRLAVLLEAPTAMKRPALIKEGKLLGVGYDETLFDGLA